MCVEDVDARSVYGDLAVGPLTRCTAEPARNAARAEVRVMTGRVRGSGEVEGAWASRGSGSLASTSSASRLGTKRRSRPSHWVDHQGHVCHHVRAHSCSLVLTRAHSCSCACRNAQARGSLTLCSTIAKTTPSGSTRPACRKRTCARGGVWCRGVVGLSYQYAGPCRAPIDLGDPVQHHRAFQLLGTVWKQMPRRADRSTGISVTALRRVRTSHTWTVHHT